MPWWAVAYVIVLAGVGVIGVIDDLNEGEPAWYVALGVTAALFSMIFVVAWWHERAAAALGKHVLPMLILSSAFTVKSLKDDLRKMRSDPYYAFPRHPWIPVAVVIVVLFVELPAYYCAVGLSVGAWFGTFN
ncbi:MAG: hypothetical protein V1792_22545 [Pseudomonadota bacterium]